MLIRDWMTTNVLSVNPQTSLLKASKLMKDNNVRRLPVLDDQKNVVGIISDRDVKAASPSKATTLDMHELYYLLSELKIKDIMTINPCTVKPTDTVETAAILMETRGFGGLPVVDENGDLVGIITDHDIFKVLVDFCGARKGGLQLAFRLPDEMGVLCPLFELLRDCGANVLSVLTSRGHVANGAGNVYIRLHPMPEDEEKKILEIVKENMPLCYWVDEKFHEVNECGKENLV